MNMSSDLANIFAKLLKRFGENYTVSYSLPPTYLKEIVGSNDVSDTKIILFYYEVKTKFSLIS